MFGTYVNVPLTKTWESGNTYTITGVSPAYAGKKHIQVRVWMASSDNNISPEVQELTTYAGDTSRRTEDATYIAQISMVSVASAIGKVFSKVKGIDWTASVPKNTQLVVRTRGTNDETKVSWSAKSAPYIKGTKRLKLKEGIYEGFLITPLINPASINPYLRIDQWNGWDDISYLPPDESDVKITYSFLDERNNVLHEVNQPKYITDRRLNTTSVANKPYRLKIHLQRRFDKATPVVDGISLSSTLIYEQDNVIENKTFSAVDNKGTGEEMILDMRDLTYNIPDEATDPTFTLIDKTERPLDVTLYLDSMKNLPSTIVKPNDTKLRLDKIWAKVKVNTTPNNAAATGVLKHYQYGGGNCIYGSPDETPMASSFTPALKEDRSYRYLITSGWFDATTQAVVEGSANKDVLIYWKSEAEASTRKALTDKSSHNAILSGKVDTSSDFIISEILEAATWGEVEWVSEEKVFFGVCNQNDALGDYIRKHETPDSGDSLDTTYVVKQDDTYESIAAVFGIDPIDLRLANGDETDATVNFGETIIIPSKIVLPKINPAAKVGSNPYHVEIVYNSVKQGGKIVSDDRINRIVLQVEDEETLIEKEEVTRGTIANGMDFLKNPKVKEILGIWNTASDVVSAPYYLSPLDYKITDNAVDWGSVQSTSKEPVAGAKYYVTYKCMKPKSVKVTIGSDYQEESGINRVWRSPEMKEYLGICEPGIDHRAELPSPSQWQGATNPEIEDLEFMIEDNDLWVKSWVEQKDGKFYAVGSLQDRIPKDNWFPYIQTGYYYLGKEEHYLFSEPIVVEPSETEVAKSANIKYVDGKYAKAARFEPGSTNLVKNSGFEVQAKGIVQKITF